MDLDGHRLQAILDAMPLMFFQKDSNNRILRTNRAAAEAVGASVESLVGTQVAEWFPDEAGAYFKDDLEVMASRMPKLDIVEQLRIDDGVKQWICTDKYPSFDAAGEVDGVFVFISDATDKTTGQHALRASEQRLRAILTAEPGGIFVFGNDGEINEINPAGLALLEADNVEEIAAANWRNLVAPEHHASYMQFVQQMRAGGAATLEYEIIGLRGRPRWVEVHGAELATTDDRSYLVVCRDVTERRHADEEREHLENQIRQSQRLESVGVLASGVAHDFNNSLMTIMGNAENALAALGPDAAGRAQLEAVLRAAEHAAGTCDQLLTYAGKQPVELEVADISSFVRQNEAKLRAAAGPLAQFSMTLGRDLPAVEIDHARLSHVLVSLVTNSCEALEGAAGRIDVVTDVRNFDTGELASGVSGVVQPGRHVVVSVADSGCGMSTEMIDQVIDPYYTTKFTGRGLDLAMALGTVRAHAGALRIRSSPGNGATVEVLLTPSAQQAPATTGDPEEHVALVTPGAILLVDDDDMVRDTVQFTLESFGYPVISADCGSAAIELYASRRDEIAAVVLDVSMPGLSGPDTYRLLAECDPQVAVLFSSGFPAQSIDVGVGVDDRVGFIQKPYSARELAERVGVVVAAGQAGT